MTPASGVFRGQAWVEAKPPKAEDLTYVSALGLGPSLGRFYLDAYFGRLFLDVCDFGHPDTWNIFDSRS